MQSSLVAGDGRSTTQCTPRKTRTLSPGSSAGEYVPADVVALSLIVDDEVADRIGQLPALPVALPKGGLVTLILVR
jgi:hypothetical protein